MSALMKGRTGVWQAGLNRSLSESEQDVSQQQLRSHASVKSQGQVNRAGFRRSLLDGAVAETDGERLKIRMKIGASIVGVLLSWWRTNSYLNRSFNFEITA